MTLAEKILTLRTQLGLSQGDLAEKLDVSRQSVSKWETGQSVPELDKIVKLADLFGITVDELVREGEPPAAESAADSPAPEPKPDPLAAREPAAPAEPSVIYVKPRPAGTQIFGVVLLVLGLLNAAWGVLTSYDIWALLSSLVVVLSLPFLLSRKHPFLLAGWVIVGLSCLFLNPRTSICPWGLIGGFQRLHLCLSGPEVVRDSYSYLMAAAVGIIRGSLMLVLTILTVRPAWKWWKARKKTTPA